MSVRSILLAVVLAVCAGAVTFGFWIIYPALAWISGGFLGAAWSWSVLAEVPE